MTGDDPDTAGGAAAEVGPAGFIAEAPADTPSAGEPVATPSIPSALPLIEDVHDLDWSAISGAVARSADRSGMRSVVERFEALLDQGGGPALLFDRHRADPADQTIVVPEIDPAAPLWIIGDLHGDLLALEAALALIARGADGEGSAPPNIVLLGDLFDDEGFGLELLLRVYELILASPGRVCVIVGNHDEALTYDGTRFASSVSPGDFAEFLNANLAHEWIERAGKLAVRFFERAPHALFLPDGLLIVHAGFPLTDLHATLEASGNWNDPSCLSDFTWTRAHPTARKKMPNRFTRGSQFGHQDFSAFCALSARLGCPVTHMVRGHDHAEERFITYPAYAAHPMLTTVALSRRLPRESFGTHERVPTLARYVPGMLPILYRLHLPADLIGQFYPPPQAASDVPAIECEA